MTSPVSDVSATLPTGTQNTTSMSGSSSTDRSQLSAQAFLQLLVAQLQYQDPSSPVDTSTLMNETATLNQIQTMQQLSSATTSQVQAQQLQTAASLVGRNVSYTDSSGATATGVVSAATLGGSSPTLTVGGQSVALSQIQQVLASA